MWIGHCFICGCHCGVGITMWQLCHWNNSGSLISQGYVNDEAIDRGQYSKAKSETTAKHATHTHGVLADTTATCHPSGAGRKNDFSGNQVDPCFLTVSFRCLGLCQLEKLRRISWHDLSIWWDRTWIAMQGKIRDKKQSSATTENNTP